MINQYKRLDVFRCRLDSHRSFSGRVSVYHVLKVKRCLPEGCFYFKWRCRLLDKGTRCIKGYHYPGRNCNSCRFYYEDKLHKVPEIRLDQAGYRRFQRELEEFEDWLGDNLGRRIEVQGRVNFVGPRLIKKIYPRGHKLYLRGYLANFSGCFLGRDRLDDYVYLRLSPGLQERVRLARGDELEFEAALTLDEGRLVLEHPRRFEFSVRGPEPFDPRRDGALVDLHSAASLDRQYERCINCERGRLVDVVERGIDGDRFLHRELYCLEGVENPGECCYSAFKEIAAER